MGTMVNNSPKNTMVNNRPKNTMMIIILDRTENDGYTSEDILHYEYMYGEKDYFKAFKEAVKNQDEKAAKCALIAYSEDYLKPLKEAAKCELIAYSEDIDLLVNVVNDVIEEFNWVVE